LKDEIILILQESQPEKVLKRLEELNALSYIFPIRKLPKGKKKIKKVVDKDKKNV